MCKRAFGCCRVRGRSLRGHIQVGNLYVVIGPTSTAEPEESIREPVYHAIRELHHGWEPNRQATPTVEASDLLDIPINEPCLSGRDCSMKLWTGSC